jgi:hypothetical protein
MMKEHAMNLLTRFATAGLLPALLLAQHRTPMTETEATTAFKTQIVVIVRDAETKQILTDPRVDIERRNDVSTGYGWSSGSFWGDGICRIALGKGIYRLRVVADGYKTEIRENVEIKTGTPGSLVSGCGHEDPQGFVVTTVIVGFMIEPTGGRRLSDQTRQFLSDTTFYSWPEVPPEPKGGMESLKKRIDLSQYRTVNESKEKRRGIPVFAHVFIDKTGKVVRVNLQGEMQSAVRDIIANAIYAAPFIPAKILDAPVCSQVYIPFDLGLAP